MAKPSPEFSLVVLNEDPEVLREISSALNSHFKILTTSDPRRALAWVENDKSVRVLMVEQVLRSGLGITVLETARQLRPEIRRIIITGYDHLESLVQGLHSGAIHRMVSKPLQKAELASLAQPIPTSSAPRMAN
jgi:DNA-binding NtrC family response regulator